MGYHDYRIHVQALLSVRTKAQGDPQGLEILSDIPNEVAKTSDLTEMVKGLDSRLT